ncbi:MAG: ATP-binding protein [Chloroflexi bacterium]|nr:ATP-binding protein [Chloroflexota bacterium]
MPDSLDIQETPVLSGAGLLGLVTTGMYSDPLSMYREYLQNAADAIAARELVATARVTITIDVSGRRVRIRDDGPGMSRKEALERLLPIGRSSKRIGADRGFRGVGRLAGLAYAKTVSFSTRACAEQSVTRITWHSERLPDLASTESELDRAILDCVDIETLPGSDYPEHFFEVELGDVARHSAGLVLNREAVRDYIGEVCPVPLGTEFPFTERVERLFAAEELPLTLEVLLDGDSVPVERPHGQAVQLSNNTEVPFTEFQEVRIPSVDDTGEAAIGWIAHSSYLGAIPRHGRLRGIRARVGNIQIGGEAVFDDLFAEERFNRWCVGELHILDSRIIPNARRDYFEPGPHLRNLENHLVPVLRHISALCRRESAARNRTRKVLTALTNVEELHALAISGLLTAEDSTRLVREGLQQLQDLQESILQRDVESGTLERLEDAESQLSSFSHRRVPPQLDDISPSEVVIYQKVFGALATLAPSPGIARNLIELVMAKTSKNHQGTPETDPDRITINNSKAAVTLRRHTATNAESPDTQSNSS